MGRADGLCSDCGRVRDGKHKTYCKACFNARKRVWYAANREKALAASKAWQEADPARWARAQRKSKLKRAYGLSEGDFMSMMEAQGHCCAICAEPLTPKGKGKGTAQVDHNHETGELRDLLCSLCNTGIGQFRESPDLLVAAAAYLIRHSMKQHEKG